MSGFDATRAAVVDPHTPVSGVRVLLDGLNAATRAAVLAAAEAEGLGAVGTRRALDDCLRGMSRRLGVATTAAGISDGIEPVFLEVSPATEDGVLCIAVRPSDSFVWGLACHAGLVGTGCNAASSSADVHRLDTAFVLEGKSPTFVWQGSQEDAKPSRCLPACLRASLLVARDAATGLVRFSPSPEPWARWLPSIEIGTKVAELTRFYGPYRKADVAALQFVDAQGKHTIRATAASREVFPESGCSDLLWRAPLRSTKTSLSYSFLRDTRQHCRHESAEVRSVFCELAGLFGDVKLARIEGIWSKTQPCTQLFAGGVVSMMATGRVMSPLGQNGCGSIPLEDRFFLGGAFGGPAERLPGFAPCGVGPAAPRRAAIAGRNYDHVGGAASVSASATLRWPLPHLGQFQGLAFATVGSLTDELRLGLPVELVKQTRASVGVGIGLPLAGDGFLGLSLAKPFLRHGGDRPQYLQFWLTFGSVV